MTRILIDNDVVLDFVLERDPFSLEAKELFRLSAKETFTAFISGITPVNVFYIGRKEKGNAQVLEAIENLLSIVEVCAVDMQVLQNAFRLNFNDYEDAVQCAAAIAENLDAIVTRNLADFKNSPVTVYSPTELLHELQIS